MTNHSWLPNLKDILGLWSIEIPFCRFQSSRNTTQKRGNWLKSDCKGCASYLFFIVSLLPSWSNRKFDPSNLRASKYSGVPSLLDSITYTRLELPFFITTSINQIITFSSKFRDRNDIVPFTVPKARVCPSALQAEEMIFSLYFSFGISVFPGVNNAKSEVPPLKSSWVNGLKASVKIESFCVSLRTG